MTLTAVVGLGLAGVAGCSPAQDSAQAQTQAAPAEPAGPAQTVALIEEASDAAYVTEVTYLSVTDRTAKIYSTAGGDPALNGLYTFIAVFGDPWEGWRVFQIGDFNSWRVEQDLGDRVVLAVSRSWMGDDGEIQTADERLIVQVPTARDQTITVTPAR